MLRAMRRSLGIAVFLPVALTLALYLPAISGAAFVADDWGLLANHLRPGDLVGEWTTATQAHAADIEGAYVWRPLPATLQQLAAGVLGREPGSFRLLNLGIHLLNTCILVFGCVRLGAKPLVAGALALAWAAHPHLVDSVAWSSQTYDLLATTFLLEASVVLLSSLAVGRKAGLLGLFFLFALLSKETAVAFLGVAVLVPLVRRAWKEAAVVGGVAAAVAGLHALWHRAVVGGFDSGPSGLERPGEVLALWTDFMAWPLTLPQRAGFLHLAEQAQVSLVGLGVLGLGALGLGLSLRDRWPSGRDLFSSVAAYALLLTPVALAAATFGQQAVRYLYTPITLGVLLLGAVRLPASATRPWLVPVLGLACVAAWAPDALQRVSAWQSEPHLYEAEWRAEPDNPVAQLAFGRVLVSGGQPEPGLELWAQAIENPPSSEFLLDVQQQRLDFAQAARASGRPDLALPMARDFIAAEEAAGNEVHPSIRALEVELAGAVEP